jgi:long-chain acyl-CoA synthetase
MSVTIGQMFAETVVRHGSVPAILDLHRHPVTEITYAQLAQIVADFGAGLVELGVMPGDRVALLSDSRPRWLISDLALLSFGAISVPRGCDTATPEIWYIVNHSEAVLAIVQDRKLYERIAGDISSAPSLRTIVMMDDSGESLGVQQGIEILDFSGVVVLGRRARTRYEQYCSRVLPGDLAAIVYTSGTTGIPKGVMLSHQNLTYQCYAIDLGFRIAPGDKQIAVLPAWHVYERIGEYFGIRHATTIFYSDKRWLRDDMAKAEPTFIPCVPRIWESVYEGVHAKLKKESAGKRRLVQLLMDCSFRFIRARRVVCRTDMRKNSACRKERMRAIVTMLASYPAHLLGDLLVYSKIRALTGRKLRAAVSGGGSLANYLDDFFEAVGIPILNGYGLTETSPVLSARSTRNNVRGTVGKPLPGTQIDIRNEQGESLPQGMAGVIWARGPQLMDGYYKNEQETRKVIDDDGWFNTGDLGWVTCTGDLVIAGRVKDTIVLSSGENVEPERIEIVARKSRLVEQIIVVGQDQKSLGALVFPNVPALAVELGLPEDSSTQSVVGHPRATRVVREDISAVMSADGSFRAVEQIPRVVLVAEGFTESNGMLTQTLKPKRNVILMRHAVLILLLFRREDGDEPANADRVA